MKCVVIDPNEGIRKLFVSSLKQLLGDKTRIVEVLRFSDAKGAVFNNQDASMVFVKEDTPTGRGDETAQSIKTTFPNLKVVLTSSASGEQGAKKLGLDGFLKVAELSDKLLQLLTRCKYA